MAEKSNSITYGGIKPYDNYHLDEQILRETFAHNKHIQQNDEIHFVPEKYKSLNTSYTENGQNRKDLPIKTIPQDTYKKIEIEKPSIQDMVEALKSSSSKFTIPAMRELLRLIHRKNVELNKSNEDIELLTYLLYNGKNFFCPVCKISCDYAAVMQENHLKSVFHAKNLSSSSIKPNHLLSIKFTKEFFENDSVQKPFNLIFPSQTSVKDLRKRFLFNFKKTQMLFKNPSSDRIVFGSRSTSTITLKPSEEEVDVGENFINFLSGFNCALCKVLIHNRHPDSITRHLVGEGHQEKLKKFMLTHPNYEFGLKNRDNFKTNVTNQQNSIVLKKSSNYDESLPFSISWKVKKIKTETESDVGQNELPKVSPPFTPSEKLELQILPSLAPQNTIDSYIAISDNENLLLSSKEFLHSQNADLKKHSSYQSEEVGSPSGSRVELIWD